MRFFPEHTGYQLIEEVKTLHKLCSTIEQKIAVVDKQQHDVCMLLFQMYPEKFCADTRCLRANRDNERVPHVIDNTCPKRRQYSADSDHS